MIIVFPIGKKIIILGEGGFADLLFPFWVGDVTLLQPWPEEESRLNIPIRPFSPAVNPFFKYKLLLFKIVFWILFMCIGMDRFCRIHVCIYWLR